MAERSDRRLSGGRASHPEKGGRGEEVDRGLQDRSVRQETAQRFLPAARRRFAIYRHSRARIPGSIKETVRGGVRQIVEADRRSTIQHAVRSLRGPGTEIVRARRLSASAGPRHRGTRQSEKRKGARERNQTPAADELLRRSRGTSFPDTDSAQSTGRLLSGHRGRL